MSARVLVRVDQDRLAGAASLRLADEAENALVFQRRIGCTDVSALIGQLHHLVLIDQLLARHSSIHSCVSVFDTHSCGTDKDIRDEQGVKLSSKYRQIQKVDFGASPASEVHPVFIMGPQTLRRYIFLTLSL